MAEQEIYQNITSLQKIEEVDEIEEFEWKSGKPPRKPLLKQNSPQPQKFDSAEYFRARELSKYWKTLEKQHSIDSNLVDTRSTSFSSLDAVSPKKDRSSPVFSVHHSMTPYLDTINSSEEKL